MEGDTRCLYKPSRGGTVLHRVIQKRIVEQTSNLEQDRLTLELFSDLLKAIIFEASTRLSSDSPDQKLLPLRLENNFDTWQQEVSKYFNIL